MVWAVSYKQYQGPIVRPLCFSRPLITTLAVPLFLLMVVRRRRAGPADKRCSVTGKALFVISQSSNLHSRKQPHWHSQAGESKYEPILVHSLGFKSQHSHSLVMYNWASYCIALSLSIFICQMGSRGGRILSTSGRLNNIMHMKHLEYSKYSTNIHIFSQSLILPSSMFRVKSSAFIFIN